MNEKFIEDNLDYEGWQAYKNGSEKFRKAVIIGLTIQMAQVNHLLNKLKINEYYDK